MKYQFFDTIVNYEIAGTGKPVVILHGLGCSLEMMRACMEPVFQNNCGYQRIYIDLPGMGKSTGSIAHASSDSILDILLHLIESIVQENYLLVGESYGGYLARGILSQDAGRVDGLMLLCPVVEPDRKKRTLPQHKLQFKDTAFLERLEVADRNNFCAQAVIANEYTFGRYKKEIVSANEIYDREFINQLEKSYGFSFAVDQTIRGLDFDKPALFLCGRQDACVGYEDLWRLLKDYKRATFSVLDAAGHNLQMEQVVLFQELVENWLLRTKGDIKYRNI